MTPEVYSSIMNVANDDSLELYSSVKIQKLGKNKPLEVNIVTPQNITKVTADMYRNQLLHLVWSMLKLCCISCPSNW